MLAALPRVLRLFGQVIPVETDPAAAMATDAAMLTAAEQGRPGIRLYNWGAVCVTLGRNQVAAQALIDPGRYPWAHRPTGGAAVLHGHDATLSVAVAIEAFGAGSRPRVRTVYRQLVAVAAELLTINGLSTRLAEDADSGFNEAPSEACFASTSRNDLVDNSGRKVCGCALRITRQAALLQTSIPLRMPEVVPGSVVCGAISVVGPFVTLTNDGAANLKRWIELTEKVKTARH